MSPQSGSGAETTLKLLIENEEILSDLYRIFAGFFPDVQSFWSGLVVEEKSHAAQLRILTGRLGAPRADISTLFSVDTLRENIRLLKEQIEKFRQKKPSLRQAIETAIEIENTMIEKRFFEAFDDQSEEARKVLRGLREFTEMHVKRLAEFATSQQSRES